MIGFLALLAWAGALYLLALPRVAPGVKVLVLTAPPVAVVVWLLDAVLGMSSAAWVVAVFVVVLIALNGLVGHPCMPTWTKITVFVTAPVAALAWLLVVTADDTIKDPGEDPCSMRYGASASPRRFPRRRTASTRAAAPTISRRAPSSCSGSVSSAACCCSR
ncbi:hypothetical protein ACFV80_19105 [Streptomyces sp. NPDC059862]|uniref:hypothetical protein n=1 Tax=Streptomyces sp. NPDC059862 TaxID=3346975 RepID=UPI00366295DD